MRLIAVLSLSLTLTACGRMGELEPVEGTSLPPAPYGASEPLSAADLLVSDPVAVPERSVELRSDSEEREDDPFDLPPEG